MISMSELLSKVREICQLFAITPSRSKGQNFLVTEKIYDDIITAAELKPTDTILEVGPGLGFLTAKLASRVKRVIAVELDDQLAAYLEMGVASQNIKNVEIINQDILRFNLDEHLLPKENYKVVANLPYNITSLFLRQFLSGSRPPQSLILMLQKEVAQRIVAIPPEMSILAISVQYYAQAKIVREVKAGNFWPTPQVDSAIIKIDLQANRLALLSSAQMNSNKKFFTLVKIGFSAKRKMLKNNLAAGLKIEPKIVASTLNQYSLDPKIRAEELSLEDWQKLFATLGRFVV